MPQIVLCPSCKMKLSLGEENLGKSVRCPGCKSIFQTPIAVALAVTEPPRPAPPRSVNPPATDDALLDQMAEEVLQSQRLEAGELEEYEEPDEEQEAQDRLQRNADRRGWRNVRFGLFCMIIALLFSVVMGVAAGSYLAQGKDYIVDAVTLLVIGGFLGSLLSLVGQAMCCAVPRRGNSRELAITSAVLNLISFLIMAYLSLLTFTAPPGQPGKPPQMVEGLFFAHLIAGAFGFFVWLLFLHQVSSSLDARPTGIAVGIFGLLTVLYVISVIVATYESGLQGLIGRKGELTLMAVGILVGGLVLLVAYFVLLGVFAGIIGKWIVNLGRK